MLKVEEIRRDFPILKTGVIYLDNAATSLTPEPVVEKTLEYYHEYRANVERGVHRLSQRASEEYGKARLKIARLINAKREDEVVFTKNTTESINLIANGIEWRKGDKIVTTLMEHHSNLIPWQRLNQQRGIDLSVVRPDREGLLNLSDFESAIDDRTRLVAVTHVSNVLGTITSVEEVAKVAHSHGALLLVDGAQSVPHMAIDVNRIGCDFLAFSVTGETPVLIRSGYETRLMPIQKVVERLANLERMQVLALDESGAVAFRPIAGWLTHKDKVYEIRHEGSGIPLRATGYHSIFVWENGEVVPKMVKHVKKDDYLITFHANYQPPQLSEVKITYTHHGNVVEEDVKVTRDLMRLVGYYLAEGSLGTGYEVRFTFGKNEQEYIQDCRCIIEKLGGTEFYERAYENVLRLREERLVQIAKKVGVHRKTVKKYLNGGQSVWSKKPKAFTYRWGSRIDVYFHSKRWYEFFRQYCSASAGRKHLPSFVWNSSKECILELLRGYLRGDASVKEKYKVRVKSISKELLVELCWLLKLHGISCTLETAKKNYRSNRPIYSLTIQKSELGSLTEFHLMMRKNISPRTKMLPADGLRRVYLKAKPRYDYRIFSLVRNDRKRITRDGVCRVIEWIKRTHKVPLTTEGLRIVTNYRLSLQSGIGTIKVREVEEAGEEDVYDVSVEKCERFFGGSYPVLLHNSGHKMLGPTGIGVLYMREGLEGEIQPQSIGGGGIKDVTQEQYKLADGPARFESGTPPIAEAIGLGEAAEYLRQRGLENIEVHEKELAKRIHEQLQAIDRVEVYGPINPDHRTGIVSFNIAQVNPHDVALALDISGNIMVRSGYHCCMPLLKDVLGLREGTVRASAYLYNTVQEVDKLIELVREVARTAEK